MCPFTSTDVLAASVRAAAQEVRHRVVPFVTGVLVDLRVVRQLRDGNHRRPRPRKCRRILDGDRVLERRRVDPLEALDQVQRLGRARPDVRPLVIGPVQEVRRVDDQRVAFPTTDRIAKPLADDPVLAPPPSTGMTMTAIAVFLVQDRDESRTLHDSIVAAVGPLPHHARHSVGQAALPGIWIQIGLEGSDSVASGGARLRFLRIRREWQLAVGRIHDERRAVGDLSRPTVILPEAVVLVAANR